MSLRRKFLVYLLAIHLPFAAIAVYLLLNNRVWMLALEAAFVASLVVGVKLVRGVFVAVDRVRDGAKFIADGDFTSRLRDVGHDEMDQLIHVYNRMVDTLRDERTRLHEQNYFLEKLMAATPLGVVTLDFEGRVVTANPAAERMLQRTASDLEGRTLVDLGGPFAEALDGLALGASCVVTLAGQRRVKCQKSEFQDRGFTRSFVTMAELTEELRQSEKAAYEKLIRMMSHEVNNTIAATNSILTSCLAYADQLDDEDREDFCGGLNAVIGRAEKLNEFVRGFAEVVRLPAPRLAPGDLRVVVDDVCELLRIEFARRRIEVVVDERARCQQVRMDRIQMEQVFVNILKNGMEAIGEDGRITIVFDERTLTIEDSGPGIPPEARAQLFTPFFTTKANGQGLGLTLVHEILTRHGFEFSLDGPPTRFVIRV